VTGESQEVEGEDSIFLPQIFHLHELSRQSYTSRKDTGMEHTPCCCGMELASSRIMLVERRRVCSFGGVTTGSDSSPPEDALENPVALAEKMPKFRLGWPIGACFGLASTAEHCLCMAARVKRAPSAYLAPRQPGQSVKV
jgi:hypothetical protein